MISAGTVAGASPDEVAQLLEASRYQQAVAESSTYLEDHPENARMRFLHGVALAGLDRDEEAAAIFEALAEAHPDWPEPANNLAVLYARQGDYEAARRWLEKALNTRSAYATAHANLGDVYDALAAAAYRKALDDEERGDNVPVNLTLVPRLHGARTPETTVAAADTVPPENRAADEQAARDTSETAPPGQANAATSATEASDEAAPADAADATDGSPEEGVGADQGAKLVRKEPAAPVDDPDGSRTGPQTDESETRDEPAATADDGDQAGTVASDTTTAQTEPKTGEATRGRQTGTEKPSEPARGATDSPAGETGDDAARTASAEPQTQAGDSASEGDAPVERMPEPSAQRADTTDETEQTSRQADPPAETSESTDEATRRAARREAAHALVTRWRNAWNDQNVSAYLATYAPNFQPDEGRTLEQWRTWRREQVNSPDSIAVEVRDIEVRSLAENRLRVSFVQDYRSDDYSDRVHKTLILARQDNGDWLILRETSRPF